jgi:hypothetical protein
MGNFTVSSRELLSRHPVDRCRPQTTPWAAGGSTAHPLPWSLVFVFGRIMQQKRWHLTALFPSFLLNMSLLPHSSSSITLPRDNQRPMNSSVTVLPRRVTFEQSPNPPQFMMQTPRQSCLRWELPSSWLLRNELGQFLTDVSGQPIGPIFDGKAILYQQVRRL